MGGHTDRQTDSFVFFSGDLVHYVFLFAFLNERDIPHLIIVLNETLSKKWWIGLS